MSQGEASDRAEPARLEALLFEISAQRFALPLCDVIEIVRAVAIRPLPAPPAITLGIIDVRGEIMPVLDLRLRLGFASKPLALEDHFVIGNAGRRRVALHVDRALELAQLAVLSPEATSNLPRGLAHVAGVAATDAGLVLIHDLGALLSQAEAQQLEAALAASAVAAEPAAE